MFTVTLVSALVSLLDFQVLLIKKHAHFKGFGALSSFLQMFTEAYEYDEGHWSLL